MSIPDNPLPPALAERFRVDRLLGEGGVGAVYRVIAGDQVFALKILLPHVLYDERMVQRFLTEGEIMKRLEHPNVLRVHEIGKDDQFPYLLCEYIEGNTLSGLLEAQGAMPWQRAFEIVLAVLSGLEAAHAMEVVHRDIKPSNVLMTKDGVPKLADFGIAKADKLAAKKTTTGMVLGSPAYMAPELLKGKGASVRSDIYSTAVMLFELISGQLPFPSDDSAESMLVRLRDDAPPLSSAVANVPKALDELIATALDREPVKRFPSVATFRMAMQKTQEQLLQSRAALTPTVGRKLAPEAAAPWEQKAPRRITRPAAVATPAPAFPWKLVAGVGLALLVAVIGGARLARRFHAEPPPPSSDNREFKVELAPEEDRLVQDVVMATPPLLAQKLHPLEELGPPARGKLLYVAWRSAPAALRDELAARLRKEASPVAVPALVDAVEDTTHDDRFREEAAGALTALTAPGPGMQDPKQCPDARIQVGRLCTILTRSINKSEPVAVVRAAIHTLGWLGHPDTPCIEALRRAPDDAGWMGTPGDDPQAAVRRALKSIDSKDARAELAKMPAEKDPREQLQQIGR